MIAWATKNAPTIAREFYDWQFSFGPTMAFFQRHAQKLKATLAALRRQIAQTQTSYIITAFEGARSNWDVAYLTHRLHVGLVHDQIDLPFKWHIGAYAEMQRLVSLHLRKALKMDGAIALEDAIYKVFNLDIQAVGASFLLTRLESMGLNLDGAEVPAGADRTEVIDQLKAAMQICCNRRARSPSSGSTTRFSTPMCRARAGWPWRSPVSRASCKNSSTTLRA